MKTKRTILLVAALLMICGVAFSDDLVLADGRYLQVKFIKGDQQGVVVKLLDTGGEIRIPWNLIRESDRDRLMRQFGLKDEVLETPMEKGVRIVAKVGDVVLGVPVGEIPPGQIPPEVVIWHEGRKETYKGDAIRRIEVAMVPSLAAFKREQLYERQYNQFPPEEDDLEGHWDMARYCMSIGYFRKAIEHLLRVKELDADYRPEYVANQIAHLEEQAKNEQIYAQLRKAMQKGFYNQFTRALGTVEQLLAIQDLSPQLRLEIEMKQQKLTAMRWKYYSRKVISGYHKLLELKLRKMSADPELKLNQAKRELRRNVHKEIVADLATKYGLDQKGEVQKMWEERKVHGSRTANYGSGTFAVLGKAKGAQKRNQRVEQALRRALGQRGGRGNDRNGSMGNSFQKLPKPPTPDEWWKKAGSGGRKNWMKAYYAENSGQMKDIRERWEACSRCGGAGTISFFGSQGEVLKVTCPRCAGHRRDKRVAYK